MLLYALGGWLVSFLLAVGTTPLVIAVYRKFGWVDDPGQYHHVKQTHTTPVPRGGGLVIFAAVALTCLWWLPVDKYLLAILASSLLLTVIGVVDDIYNISPVIRLITGLIAALIVVGSGIGIAYVSNPFGPGVIHLDQPQLIFSALGKVWTVWVLADLFALLFILWNMNIVNWSKGVDGQMPGFVAIAVIFSGLLSQRFSGDPTQFSVLSLSFIVSGAFAGFLVWNMYPQKLMAGYGAGSLAGFFLSILAILSGAKVATTLMVLAIPTADALFTIARRIKAGKSPLWGDRGHLHHKLMDVFGWGRRRIAFFYWASSLALGILSLYLNTLGKLITMGVTMGVVFGFLIWAKLYSRRNHTL
jgi:UDP-GlcNAc:undecaprenyl-phosphate GlcNAc-1-phosphate transferase